VLKKYILKSCKKNCLNIWLVKSQKKQIREIFLMLFLQKKIQKKFQKELVCLEGSLRGPLRGLEEDPRSPHQFLFSAKTGRHLIVRKALVFQFLIFNS
jgi:hypothetical protein